DDHPAVRRLRAPADDREILHAEGPLDPWQGHHAGHRGRDSERHAGGEGTAAAGARPDGGAQEGRSGAAGARRDQDDADHRAAAPGTEPTGSGPAAVAATHARIKGDARPDSAASPLLSAHVAWARAPIV